MSAANRDSTGWAIEFAAAADISAVLQLWREAGASPSATGTKVVAGLLAHDPNALLLARANTHIVGTLVAGWDGWRGNLYRLAVHPDWRRQGIATALIRGGEKRLRDLGARRLAAVVSKQDPDAVSTWESAGYEREAHTGRFIRMLPRAVHAGNEE